MVNENKLYNTKRTHILNEMARPPNRADAPTAPTAPVAPTTRDTQVGGDHYKTKAVQPWDVYDTWPTEQRIGAYRANCLKYVMRLGDKDTPCINAKKLVHYAQKLVEVLEEPQ